MRDETRLWLIRHAPVAGATGVLYGDDAPADTSDTAKLAWLRKQLPSEAVAICSPARRTIDTAIALGLVPTEEPAYREQDFGNWTGHRHSELAENFGDSYAAFWQSPASNRPPCGESFVDQIARVEKGLAKLPAGDIVLILHSGTIRAVLTIALNLTPDRGLSFVLDPLSLTRVYRLENAWSIAAINHTPTFQERVSRKRI